MSGVGDAVRPVVKFSWSDYGECYFGAFDSAEEALEDAKATDPDCSLFYIGHNTPPPAPEGYWSAELWLEHVANQEEYCGDCGADWDESTPEQRAELEALVQPVLAAWLDKHNLRAKFFNVNDAVEYPVITADAAE